MRRGPGLPRCPGLQRGGVVGRAATATPGEEAGRCAGRARGGGGNARPGSFLRNWDVRPPPPQLFLENTAFLALSPKHCVSPKDPQGGTTFNVTWEIVGGQFFGPRVVAEGITRVQRSNDQSPPLANRKKPSRDHKCGQCVSLSVRAMRACFPLFFLFFK